MRSLTLLVALAAPLLGASLSAQQQYETLLRESFDYPAGSLEGQNGGSGFSDVWWSGGATGPHAEVVVPGFDAIGGMVQTLVENEGSYRPMDMSGKDPITEYGLYGKDNTTIWVAFDCQRMPGGDDQYGGLSFSWKWVGEQLLIGSPYPRIEWGMDRPWAAPIVWIPNTSCDFQAHLVVKIDFLPGDENLKMWVNPPSDHPDPLVTIPDLDVWYPDFRFNELMIQSGQGLNTGFLVDNVTVTTPVFRPIYTATNVLAGALGVFSVTNATPGDEVRIGYSLTGAGPTTTVFGDVAMSLPISTLVSLTADAAGNATTSIPIPIAAQGRTIWTQAVDISGPGTGILSNPLVVTVQ